MKVRFSEVCKAYGDFVAVDDLTLTIKSGAFHFLLGPSGCGKTTSLRMLAGLEAPTSGRIQFGERDVTTVGSAQRGVGMVFQNYALWPHMTVRENIEYGLKIKKLPRPEIRSRVEEALAMTRLERFDTRYPGQLSGGQQQRVALARSLAIRPNILLLDEPLSNLDAKLRHEMRANLLRIHRQTRITTLYVTHDQKEALAMGTHVTVMQGGKEIQTGTPKELYRFPKSAFLAGFVGDTNLLRGVFRGSDEHGYLVESEIGILRARHSAGTFADGDSVTLSVRPEALSCSRGDGDWPAKENVRATRLVDATYFGESEQLLLACGPESTLLKANRVALADHDFELEGNLSCYIDPASAVIVPEDRPVRST